MGISTNLSSTTPEAVECYETLTAIAALLLRKQPMLHAIKNCGVTLECRDDGAPDDNTIVGSLCPGSRGYFVIVEDNQGAWLEYFDGDNWNYMIVAK